MRNGILRIGTFLVASTLVAPAATSAGTLEVGPGRPFARIEHACEKAKPGDTILVHPRTGNRPYEKVAVFVRTKNLTFKVAQGKTVILSGKGFDYSGSGSTPRAIIQFNKGTDNCTLEGFELTGAHNKSHNGAGIRINQANNISIRKCHIHGNDMGVMSNGDGTQKAAVNQMIENCVIHHNGSYEEPGYNHNLYLGGTSVTLRFCEIHHSLTGHNIKSRAHHTRVVYSYIHDSANREFDLVNSADTEQKNSDAVLVGNIIVKDPKCKGNRAVLHFGKDSGKTGHDGTAFLIHNTIVTPFISPIITLSTPESKAILTGNFICDGGVKQSGQRIAIVQNGADASNVSGTHNWFDRGFSPESDTALSPKDNFFGQHIASPFADKKTHDYRPQKTLKKGSARNALRYSACPGAVQREKPLAWEYLHPAGSRKRQAAQRSTLGAHE